MNSSGISTHDSLELSGFTCKPSTSINASRTLRTLLRNPKERVMAAVYYTTVFAHVDVFIERYRNKLVPLVCRIT